MLEDGGIIFTEEGWCEIVVRAQKHGLTMQLPLQVNKGWLTFARPPVPFLPSFH